MGMRVGVTAGAYLASFVEVRQPFNNCWWLVDAPLHAFGFVRSPASLRDLIGSIIHAAKSDPGIRSNAMERETSGALCNEPAFVPTDPAHSTGTGRSFPVSTTPTK
jgi:hypothetical protein